MRSADGERPELGVAREVPPRVGARRDDAEALLPRERERRLGQVRRDVATAERRRRVRVLDVEQVAASLVHELGLEPVDAGHEPAGLVLDAKLHGVVMTDRRGPSTRR